MGLFSKKLDLPSTETALPGRDTQVPVPETHFVNDNPTQGMRQGNDIGTQYRSGIYTFDHAQQSAALESQAVFQEKLRSGGFPEITTEIVPAPAFYYAEHYHQQYLAKVPNGYCGLGGTGVSYQD